MEKNDLSLVVQAQMGLQMCLLHVFTCLHHKGIISLSEAASSLDATEKELSGYPLATRQMVKMTAGLIHLAAGDQPPPNPSTPTPPTRRPDLRIIQGGRTD